MNWEDVLKRNDIVGGDIEIQEKDGCIYRGPISSIKIENGRVCIELSWMACMSLSLGKFWEPYHITSYSISTNTRLSDIGDNRLCFQPPGLGFCVIFPKGGSKLNPANVKGLKI